MKRQFAFVWVASGLALMLIPFTIVLKSRVSASNSKTKPPTHELARLGATATVHAAGRGAPHINLADGRDLLTAYAGEAEAQRLLQQNVVQPLAMASSDFDEDGVPDLVSGNAAPNGGMLTLYRGNVDSIYPNSLEAQQRKARGEFSDQPFLSPARAFDLPEAPDFLGGGDFDADGHWDVVTASRQDNALYLLTGDGHGNFAAARRIELPGRVTAIATGEVNRADGLTDVVVGIVAANGPKALVFESPEGALRGKGEEFNLPAEATAIAIGNLDEEYTMDIAVTAGSDLVCIYGRDRKLSLDEQRQAGVPEARISQRSFPFALKGVAIGDFKGEHKTGLSLLTSEGSVHLLTPSEAKTKKKKKSAGVESWKDEVLASGVGAQATQMVCARVSSIPSDDLVIVDPASRQLHIIAGGKDSSAQASSVQPVSLDVESEPVAVLPMRLKSYALSDLVVLRSGAITPSSVVHIAAAFQVTNTNDSGAGSLRQAILNANGNAGLDMITFAIGSGPQTITPLSILPNITDAVVIDGTTQPGFAGTPIIELNGSSAGTNVTALSISAGNSTVRGLVINRFNGNGIFVETGGNNIIDDNYIGTDVNGTADLGNGFDGVLIQDASNNTIGGTAAGARNVISGNDNTGVVIFAFAAVATGNSVQACYIGTNALGTTAVPNGSNGVLIAAAAGFVASNNTIGGTTPAARNLIAGNSNNGLSLNNSANNNLIQGNFIGTNATGSAAIANGSSGVGITSPGTPCTNNTIGGTAPGAGNLISGNTQQGVAIAGTGFNNNVVQGNFIGTDASGTAALGNTSDGVFIFNNASNNTIGGTSAGARNVISGNLGNGISVQFGTGNQVQGNFIGTNAAGTGAVGNGLNGISISIVSAASAVSNRAGDISINAVSNDTIGGITPAARNLISGNSGNGILISGSDSNQVQGNFIGTQADGTSSLGNGAGGVSITASASNNTIGAAIVGAGNTIAFNGGTGVTVSSGTGNAVQSNSIFSNAGRGIDLGGLGVTPNDNCDGDAGANNLQNFPVLTSASSVGGNTTVAGTLNSTALTTFRIEFFSNASCDPSGNGEGRTFIGSTNVMTASDCGATFNAVLPAVSVGNVITATATDPGNNTSEFSKCVTVAVGGACVLTCPPNQIRNTDANQCGAVVTYPDAIASGLCGGAKCTPASGSFFPTGTTVVSCAASGTFNCSFGVTVVDKTPPNITCPANIFTSTDPGKAAAVVDYGLAKVSDNCPGATALCLPRSGTVFPLGVSTVICSAQDAAGNAALCSFTVNVSDTEPPAIRCPANLTFVPPSGQTSAVVNYPPPSVSDNVPGASVVCSPASGSTFPLGTTTVTCTATDAQGNKASCSFIVSVGGPQIRVTFPAGKTAVEFATVPPARKVPKPKNRPCSPFTVENIGFAPLVLTFDSFKRTGIDVTNGRITDPNDVNVVAEIGSTKFFVLNLVNPDQSRTQLNIGGVLTLQPGQAQPLCVEFAALIPGLAGKTTGLAASDVLPDMVTSTITFRQNAGANVAIPVLARVATGVVLIDPANPRRQPVVSFARSGNDITVSYAVFDSNLDVSRARYEFLNASGQVIAGPFEIDLTEPLRSLNLVKGQSFSVEQRFTGASGNPEITRVRLTVFDGETSVVSSSSISAPSVSASSIKLMNRARRVTLYLPDVSLRPKLP